MQQHTDTNNDNNDVVTAVQLGFCESVDENKEDNLNALNHIGHRSHDYRDWDGGQVGGTPSWLIPDVEQVLSADTDCTCKHCTRQLRFVCQLYAPIDELPCCKIDSNDNPSNTSNHFGASDRAFHRTLYVFACPYCPHTMTGSVRVWRAQLPRNNPYYHDLENVDSETNDKDLEHSLQVVKDFKRQLCQVCGLKGMGKCPKQNMWFCGKAHQQEYYRFNRSLSPTKDNDDDDQDNLKSRLNNVNSYHYLPSVHPLYELVVEDEPEMNDKNTNNNTNEALAITNDDDGDDSDADLEQEDLNMMLKGGNKEFRSNLICNNNSRNNVNTDPVTLDYFAKIQIAKTLLVQSQCIRYQRWPTDSSRLIWWIRSEGRLFLEHDKSNNNDEDYKIKDFTNHENNNSKDNSNTTDTNSVNASYCQHCGAPRKVELEILPSMLSYLLKDRATVGTDWQRLATPAKTKALQQAEMYMESVPPEWTPPALVEAREAHQEAARKLLGQQAIDDSTIVSDNINAHVDWGVIVIYTCTMSCNGKTTEATKGSGYVEEFAWRQPSIDVELIK